MQSYARRSHVPGCSALLSGLLLLLLVLRVSSATTPTPSPVSLFVIHRHGARRPDPPPSIADKICGGECGQLTDQGVAMMKQLGSTIKQQFPSVPFATVSSARGTLYDPRRLVSRSVDIDRTLQSADAFLSGLLSGGPSSTTTSGLYPAVHAVADDRDVELDPWASWPALVLHSNATQASFNAMMNAELASQFSPDDLATIGAALGLANCTPSTRFQCVLVAADVLISADANEPVSTVEALWRPLIPYRRRLTQAIALYNSASFYNASVPFDAAVGTKGHLLVQAIAAAAEETQEAMVNGFDPDRAPPVLHHFSGHDTTLMAFAETLDIALPNPPFGAAFVVQLLNDTATGADESTTSTSTTPTASVTQAATGLQVSLSYLTPNQEYGSTHAYTMQSVEMFCTDSSSGATYKSLSCSLDQWLQYLRSRGPQAPQGICFAARADLRHFGCLPGTDKVGSRGPTDPLCRWYRQRCPEFACLTEAGANGASCDEANASSATTLKPVEEGGCVVRALTSNLTCLPVAYVPSTTLNPPSDSSGDGRVQSSIVLVAAVCSFLLGAGIAAIAASVLHFRLLRSAVRTTRAELLDVGGTKGTVFDEEEDVDGAHRFGCESIPYGARGGGTGTAATPGTECESMARADRGYGATTQRQEARHGDSSLPHPSRSGRTTTAAGRWQRFIDAVRTSLPGPPRNTQYVADGSNSDGSDFVESPESIRKRREAEASYLAKLRQREPVLPKHTSTPTGRGRASSRGCRGRTRTPGGQLRVGGGSTTAALLLAGLVPLQDDPIPQPQPRASTTVDTIPARLVPLDDDRS